jgi:XTP/dITP diphosphohydrolase
MSKPRKIVVATKNKGKTKEFAAMFGKLGFEVLNLLDFSGLPEIVEDGKTFQENAWKKASVIAEHLQMPVLADDSGLCVDALDGQPGVYSARYAGEYASDEENNRKLLRELEKLDLTPDENGCVSGASFVCSLVLAVPNGGNNVSVEGVLRGCITKNPRGAEGFGYDPLFFVPRLQKTLAELTLEEKNEISHRSRALQKLQEVLNNGDAVFS